MSQATDSATATKRLTIAVDTMSGDHGLAPVMPAVRQALHAWPQLHLLLVGNLAAMQAEIERLRGFPAHRVTLLNAGDVIRQDQSPVAALRNGRQSSMWLSLLRVAQGEADACVSAGNTGALMAMARKAVGMLEGVDRPAIVSPVPTATESGWGHTWMLDLGANLDCSSEQLFQFACMGSALARGIDSNPAPRVSLLNIGEEETKGRSTVRECSQMLRDCQLNYQGYIEGNAVFDGAADVVVCDGFSGNIALKTVEGVIRMTAKVVHDEFRSNAMHQAIGLLAWPVLTGFRRRMDPRKFNGAMLLGLRHVVVKSHGAADSLAFYHAIRVAVEAASTRVPALIQQQVAGALASQQRTAS